VKMREYRRTKC